MSPISRKRPIGPADDRVLMYSALFFVCAAISASGASTLGAMAFLPAAVLLEFVVQHRHGCGGDDDR